MPLHLVSAKRLAAELAAGTVSAKEQAQYLAASFVIWALPVSLFVIPTFYSNDRGFSLSLWIYESAVLLLVYCGGSLFCLRNCRVEPKKNFLVDFGCLYAPISLTTLVTAWGGYHALMGLMSLLANSSATANVAWALRPLYSERFLDVLRVVFVIGSTTVVFYRIGMRLAAIAEIRRDG
jgi:hypothetical protein